MTQEDEEEEPRKKERKKERKERKEKHDDSAPGYMEVCSRTGVEAG